MAKKHLCYELACFSCGKPFRVRRSDAKTCSPACRQRLKRGGGWVHGNARNHALNNLVLSDGTKGGLVFRPH